MSRFEETLQRDLRRIAERATPSPDAWERIQRRVAVQDPPQETEIIMLVDTIHPPMRRWPLAAAAAALVAIIFGATALLLRDTDKQTPAVDTETVEEDGAPVAPLFQQLPSPGAGLAGGYTVETLGVPVSLVVPDATSTPWTLQVSDAVAVSLGTDDGFLAMSRIGSFYGAGEALDPEMAGLGSLPADDIDGWIAANDVIVSERSEATVGGRTAQYRQVTASAGSGQGSERCPPDLPDPPCLGVTTASADLQSTYDGPSAVLWGTVPHSIWVVELGDYEPLLIWAHSDTMDAAAWLEVVTPLIESIEIGEPAPATNGGTALLPIRVSAAAGGRLVNTSGPPNADASVPVSSTGTVNGDATGDTTGTGVRYTLPPDDLAGNGAYTFTGSIDGLGTGTLDWTDEWTSIDGVYRSSGTITGGTGDFADASGTVTFSLRTTNFIDQTSEEVLGTLVFDLAFPSSG